MTTINGAGLDTDVIIIGSGPVGMSAALLLDRLGVRSTIIERRPFGALPNVKSNHVSARTMERFRQMGIAADVREAGLPGNHPHDISFRTALTGDEFGRVPIPCRDERFTSHNGPDTKWATPEPPHRINQTFLEPVLLSKVAESANIAIVNDVEFLSYEQTESAVSAHIADVDGGGTRTLTGRFLLGADGGSSRVRKQIGAKFVGDPVIQNVMSTCIRARGLYDEMPGERAWAYYTFNSRRNGHVYSIDGHDVFLVHNHLSPEEAEAGSVDRDDSIRAILGVDESFEFEILSNEDWTARRLVAERFRDGRVFIAGDAAHLWVPYAGYGMNAGIADGLNLAWLLAAQISGWAEYSMLDAYEAERLPITDQVSRFAMSHAKKENSARAELPANLAEDSEEGRAARREAGQQAVLLNSQQFAAEGLNFGYVYDSSPIIAYDGFPAPGYTMDSYTPSTVPGCRLPHFWLDKDVSVYDRLGDYYTLVRMDQNLEIGSLLAAVERSDLPLTVVDITAGTPAPGIDHGLLIVRPDQHIAWRGYRQPTEPDALIARLKGASEPDDHRAEIGKFGTEGQVLLSAGE